MAKVWSEKGLIEMDDEQTERIAEGVRDWMANPEDYSFSDLEDLFEDRDPCEFL
jgi:hypothetical protein